MMSHLNPEVESITRKYKESLSSRYSNRSKTYQTQQRSRNAEARKIATDKLTRVGEYLELPDEGLIKPEWKEAYELCRIGRVPEQWASPFMDQDGLGNSKKEEAMYCLS